MVPPLQTEATQPQVPSLPHFRPQLPQLLASVAVLTSQALAPFLSQSRVPAPQAAQTPVWQNWVPLQTLGQVPQWLPSVLVLISQPFPGSPSQSAVPGGHESPQTPALQTCPTPQGWLQPPQCALVMLVLVSQPLAWLPSQLPQPPLQPVKV